MHHAILTQSDLGCIAKVWTTKVANPVVYPLLKKLKKNDAAMAYALDKQKVNFTERRHTRGRPLVCDIGVDKMTSFLETDVELHHMLYSFVLRDDLSITHPEKLIQKLQNPKTY